jgi:protease IV
MSQADDWLNARLLRRKVIFWRIAAILLACATGVFGFAYVNGGFRDINHSPHIAKIRIEGTISEDENLMALFKDTSENKNIKGVILAINSPGGTTVGGESIYEAVRNLAQKKPVVAQVGTLAASAGYMIATGTDHIVARKTSIIGSIGVIFQYPDISELLSKAGIKVESIKSSPLKAEPNFFTPASPQAKAMIERMIRDSYDWFVGLVDERRPLDRAQTLALSDGSVFTGQQALQNKLIDAIGGEEVAIAWLVRKGVDKNLKIIEHMPQAENRPWWAFSARMSDSLFHFFGISNDTNGLIGPILRNNRFGDGLLSLFGVDTLAYDRNK